MNAIELLAFTQLFKEAAKKCFGHALTEPLSETESKLFSNKILDETGLVVGWKSLKNYSIYIMEEAGNKPENPSVPSLDTIARYVLNAPYTDEPSRKEKESHYPYWFEYKNRSAAPDSKKHILKPVPVSFNKFYTLALVIIAVVAGIFIYTKESGAPGSFRDDFGNGNDLLAKGWSIKDLDPGYWAKRNEKPGYLTLFTLRGDNWPDTLAVEPAIKNLVYRPCPYDCFTTELLLQDFLPRSRWQQSGILLMEDSSLNAKCIRLSIAYNDYFGGYNKSPEILVQAITSFGKEFKKPEEIAHYTLYSVDSLQNNSSLVQNFKHSSLRIEKTGDHFRFLYAGGNMPNGAYHEVASKEINFHPKYIGIFALKGFVNDEIVVPVYLTTFHLAGFKCP